MFVVIDFPFLIHSCLHSVDTKCSHIRETAFFVWDLFLGGTSQYCGWIKLAGQKFHCLIIPDFHTVLSEGAREAWVLKGRGVRCSQSCLLLLPVSTCMVFSRILSSSDLFFLHLYNEDSDNLLVRLLSQRKEFMAVKCLHRVGKSVVTYNFVSCLLGFHMSSVMMEQNLT